MSGSGSCWPLLLCWEYGRHAGRMPQQMGCLKYPQSSSLNLDPSHDLHASCCTAGKLAAICSQAMIQQTVPAAHESTNVQGHPSHLGDRKTRGHVAGGSLTTFPFAHTHEIADLRVTCRDPTTQPSLRIHAHSQAY